MAPYPYACETTDDVALVAFHLPAEGCLPCADAAERRGKRNPSLRALAASIRAAAEPARKEGP